jgi:HAE1 family hydrophobic/amphiphilic exporter-1
MRCEGIAENNFRNEFIKLPGIAEVRLSGEQDKEVVLETDPDLLASFGLTVNDLVTKIQNYNRSVSGGFIEELGRKYVIKGLGIIEKPEDLRSWLLVIHSRGNTVANPETLLYQHLQPRSNTAPSSDQVPVVLREVASIQILEQRREQHREGQSEEKRRDVDL